MSRCTSTKTVFDFLKSKMVPGQAYTSTEVKNLLAGRFDFSDDYANKRVLNMTTKGVLERLKPNKHCHSFIYYINESFDAENIVSPLKGRPRAKTKKRYREVVNYLTSAGEFLFEMAKMNGVRQ